MRSGAQTKRKGNSVQRHISYHFYITFILLNFKVYNLEIIADIVFLAKLQLGTLNWDNFVKL